MGGGLNLLKLSRRGMSLMRQTLYSKYLCKGIIACGVKWEEGENTLPFTPEEVYGVSTSCGVISTRLPPARAALTVACSR